MFLGVIAAVILSGCGAPVSTGILDSDWCYLFDFTKNQQGFVISSGTWLPEGIASDSTGLLQTSYGYDRDVYPAIVQVRVFRPAGVEGDILVTAAGTVFGISANFTAPMVSDLDSAELTFTPDGDGVEYIGDRNAINITVDATQPIGIESIFIGGPGASPFPHNICADPTPTPPIDINGTGTPTPSTPTASPTPTGTWESPTPSPTPAVDEWICTYEGESLETQISAYFAGAIWSGTGWAANPSSNNRINIQGNVTGRYIEDITIFMTAPPGGDANVIRLHDVGNPAYRAQIGAGYETVIPVASALGAFYFDVISNWSGSGAPITGEIYKLELTGTGEYIPGVDCEPIGYEEPTPGPSNTPLPSPTMGPTNTPEPLWGGCADFTASSFSFIGIGAEYEDERGFIQDDPDEWSVGRSGLEPSRKKLVKLEFGAAQSFSGQVRFTDNASNATSWLTVAGNEIFLDYSVSPWIPTSTFWIEFDGGFDGLILERICWADLAPSGTPIPSGSRTPLPTVTGTIPPSRTPIQVPAPVIIITATAGIYITTTPIYGGTGVYSPSGTPSLLITGTPGTEGTPGGDGSGGTGYGSGGGGFGDVGDILGFGWNIGWGLFGALIAYLGQAGSIVTSLLTAFANATPQAIPGLPLCMTNPMAHDLCAVYYILDNTIFAQATPGALIIPLLLIMMNMWIAVYFVRWVLRIIRRGEAVTDVE